MTESLSPNIQAGVAQAPRRNSIGILIFALGFLILLIGLVELRARDELKIARQAAGSVDIQKSIKHYSRALNWYLPFGAAGTAAREMFQMGEKFIADGQTKQAMLAFSRVRSGLYGARSFYVPQIDLIRKTELYLADIMARNKLGDGAEKEAFAATRQEYLNLMRKKATPAVGPSIAVSAGFLIWVLAVILFIFRYVHDKGSFDRAWIWTFVWTVGFIVWLWGMKWS